MKILKKGKKKVTSMEVTCTGNGNGDNGCGAELLITPKDIEIMGSGMDDEENAKPCVECSECKVITVLINPPDLMTQLAWKRYNEEL